MLLALKYRAMVAREEHDKSHVLSFLLPLYQEGQLSVTGESIVHEVLVNCLVGLSLPGESVVRLTDRPDMTIDALMDVKLQDYNNKIKLHKKILISIYCLCTTESTNNGVGLQVLTTLVTALPLKHIQNVQHGVQVVHR